MARKRLETPVVPCCRPGCGRSVYARGLCHSDYTAALGKIRDGALAWADLEAAGLASPPKRAPASSRDWLDDVKRVSP